MRQFVGFIFAGGIATVLNFSIFLCLLKINVQPTLAAAIGYLSGILVSFAINKFIVFSNSQRASLWRYFVSYGAALLGQLAVLNLLLLSELGPEISNAVAIFFIVILNFFLVRSFVFKK